ncbi:MAG: DUF2442 domain-containing protein [Planctomycetaceae bacterium]
MAKPKVIHIGRWEWTDAEFEAMHAAATKRGQERLRNEPLVVGAKYDSRSEHVVLQLNNGSTYAIPANLLQGVADGTPAERADIRILGVGTALEWTTLDMHFSVVGLLAGRFGTRRWMAQRGAKPSSAATTRGIKKPASRTKRSVVAS